MSNRERRAAVGNNYRGGLMEWHRALKTSVPDALVAIGNGEFYEFIGRDAEIVATLLDLPIASLDGRRCVTIIRGCQGAADLARIVDAGHRIIEFVWADSSGVNEVRPLARDEMAELAAMGPIGSGPGWFSLIPGGDGR